MIQLFVFSPERSRICDDGRLRRRWATWRWRQTACPVSWLTTRWTIANRSITSCLAPKSRCRQSPSSECHGLLLTFRIIFCKIDSVLPTVYYVGNYLFWLPSVGNYTKIQLNPCRFPAEIVAVDVSGKGFHRMSMRRKSMHTGHESQDTVKRRSRPRRPRGKRRNTIAGTDQKEIRKAVGGWVNYIRTISKLHIRTHHQRSPNPRDNGPIDNGPAPFVTLDKIERIPRADVRGAYKTKGTGTVKPLL